MDMRLPDFFIAGAARSGTTSLWRWLCRHPGVYMPETLAEKEPCHFCRNGFIRERAAYLRLFRQARPDQLVGEASTYYLNWPESPGLIRAEIPHAKFIFILRQPADRAYSLYNWMLAEGYEPIYPFAAALAAEERERWGHPRWQSDPNYYGLCYFHSGLYAEAIERYLAAFGRSQMLFLIFEEMIRAPAQALVQVCDFLGLPPQPEMSLAQENASRGVRLPRLQYFLRQHLQPMMQRLRLPGQRHIVAWLMARNLQSPPPFSPAMRRSLTARYADDIRRTAGLLGCNLDLWLEEKM